MADFQDVKIIGFDDAASGPSGHGKLMNMVLNLSSDTTGVWGAKFNAAWKEHFYMGKRDVSVAGPELIVVCTPEELQGLIDEIKKVVAKTNTAMHEYVARDTAARQAAAEEAAKEREALTKLKGSLKFD